MALGWNEIKSRAVKFSKEWAGTCNEEADAKPFLVDFFNVFGISQHRVASFEHRVKKLGDSDGYIDLLWKGTPRLPHDCIVWLYFQTTKPRDAIAREPGGISF